jgi:uncharacterized protein HemY
MDIATITKITDYETAAEVGRRAELFARFCLAYANHQRALAYTGDLEAARRALDEAREATEQQPFVLKDAAEACTRRRDELQVTRKNTEVRYRDRDAHLASVAAGRDPRT